jgi:hypothetical protein
MDDKTTGVGSERGGSAEQMSGRGDGHPRLASISRRHALRIA